MQATPEQYDAIYIHDKNLIVTAGAGTGKTRVLVERFTTLLDANRGWRLPMIVAITFTEKAAREMRDRVRTNIIQRTQHAASTEDRAFWQQQQTLLDAARISTIHRLCTQILRANPVEAQLDPGFTVLDEVDAQLLKNEAVEASIAALLDDQQPAIVALLSVYEVRTLQAVLAEYAARSAAKSLLATLENQMADDLLAKWQAAWSAQSQQQAQALQENPTLHAALGWIEIVDGPHLQGDKRRDVWGAVLQHTHKLLHSDDPASVREAAEAMVKVINLRGGREAVWGEHWAESKAQLEAIRDTLNAFLSQMLPPPGAISEQGAELLLAWRDVIAVVHRHYETLKDEQNTLDFDDLEERTADLLEAFPHVAARYADPDTGEFKHIMVDEFQDTNDNQRRIVYALAGIDPYTGTATPGRLFVVGDPKQSIYAFRGADVSVFDRVQREILATGGQSLALTKSFRSHPYLVGMFNDVFRHILQRQDDAPMGAYSVGYASMSANRPPELQHETPLALHILTKPDKDDPDYKKINADVIRAYEAQQIATFIEQQVASGTANYGDIALLFQSMTHVGVYEDSLQAAGIPYVTVAGRGYFDRQEVWDIMKLLAVLHRPADNLALATVLRSPMFGLSDDALFALRLRKRDDKLLPLWEALMATDLDDTWPPIETEEDRASIAFAQAVLPELHQLAGRVTIAELLQAALEETGFEAVLVGLPNGERRRANVRKLLSVARDSEQISLSDFTLRLRNLVAVEAREGEATLETENVVQLMTVHKSKGLEFPIVIVPQSARTRNATKPTLFVDPQLGSVCKILQPDGETLEPTPYQLAMNNTTARDDYERRRLLYVAMTRAEDTLLLTGEDKPGKGWLGQLRAALTTEHYPFEDTLIPGQTVARYEWGNAALICTEVAAQLPDSATVGTDTTTALTETPIYADDVIPSPPPLLGTPRIDIPGERLHVPATDLERFGRIRFENPEADARQEFRLRVLSNLPGPVMPLSPAETRQRRVYTVQGNTLHHALQLDILPRKHDKQTVYDVLAAYVWEQGIGDERTRNRIVKNAITTLHRYENSTLAAQLDAADQVHREIAFVLEFGRYVIHGIIDLLFYAKGQWHVIDYKSGRPAKDMSLNNYAERYVYQMGAYALAIEAQTGEVPSVAIYFLHNNRLVPIAEDRWRAAMDTLDAELEEALNET
jgi:ATP-dependent helicase/nuclease subunit A